MTWFLFYYWYEPDAPKDPVGLVRMWALADALAKCGDRVTLFPPRYRSAFVRRACTVISINLIHLRLARPLSYAMLSFVRGLMQALVSRPDIVYYRWMDSPHAVLFAKLLGVPCVCEVSGEPIPEWSKKYGRPVRWLRYRMARFALKRCDRVVALTNGLKELLVVRYGVPAERIAVLPSGTDLQTFCPRDASVCRRDLGLSPDRRYVGFVGSFYRYQGLRCLLDAMVIIGQSRPNIHLLLVGDGEAAEELKAQAKRVGLGDIITWVGRVPYQEVPAWIGAMDICVAPFCGNRGETSPVKVFDYQACGKPVVAGAIPSVTAVFSPANGVVLAHPDRPEALADAVLALLSCPDEARRLGRLGRLFVEQRFGWDAIVRTLLTVVSDITPHDHRPRLVE